MTGGSRAPLRVGAAFALLAIALVVAVGRSSAAQTVTISGVRALEGNSATGTSFLFVARVTRTETASEDEVRLNFRTLDATAVGGPECNPDADFVHRSGILVFRFPAGAATATATIAVRVCGDTVVESDEMFFVSMARLQGEVARAGGTIVNDDSPLPTPTSTPTATPPPPTPTPTATRPAPTPTPTRAPPTPTPTPIRPAPTSTPTATPPAPTPTPTPLVESNVSVTDVNVVEGNAAVTAATVVVRLSAPSTTPVTVDFATADGTATAPADYAPGGGTLVFRPGEVARSIGVAVVGDASEEPNEYFTLTVAGATNAVVLRPAATVTIVDDDGPPSLSVLDASVQEGTSAAPTTASFEVKLAPASARTVTITLQTRANTAVEGADFIPAAGVLTFLPGQTEKLVGVNLVADAEDEPDETFFVASAGVTNALVADGQATGTILDDDEKSRAAAGPAVALRTKTLLVERSGVVRFTLACPARTPGGCAGTANLHQTLGAGAGRETVFVGYTRFKIPAGKAKALRLTLSGAARSAVRRYGRVRGFLGILAFDGANNSRTVIAHVTIRQAAPVAVVIVSQAVSVARNGAARVRVRCPIAAPERCSGSVVLQTPRHRIAPTSRTQVTRRGATVRIGTGRFAADPGQTRIALVRLSRAAQAALERSRRLFATATVTGRAAETRLKLVRRTIVLRPTGVR